MKHHLLISAAAAAIIAPLASAKPVTPQEALRRLQSADTPARVAALARPHMECVAELPGLYVFSQGKGFVILPADDAAPALLAYADQGSFDIDSNPTLRWWLSTYSRQIEQAQHSGFRAQEVMRPSRPAIAPLTVTQWNQDAPYNDLCPELNGEKCVTGCVATAMAQILKYHAYPAKGSGTHSYTWQEGNKTLSFDYNTTFAWDEMPDIYTSASTDAQNAAVAKLMYACGVSVNMMYDPGDSGAYTTAIAPALMQYFGYDKAMWNPQRPYYTLGDWEQLVYDNLAQGMPVLYAGVGSAGGHQFICDGYSQDGYFHFNWGWGGMSNGYFLLTALDPPALGIGGGAGGFNSEQSVILGIKPAEAGSVQKVLILCGQGFTPEAATVQLGQPAYFEGGFYNYSCAAIPPGTAFGIQTTRQGEAPVYHTSAVTQDSMAIGYGYSKLGMLFPSGFAEGIYTVRPAFKPVGGEWTVIPSPLSANQQLTATVANGTVTFTAPDAPKLNVTNLSLTSPLYWDEEFTLSFTTTNAGDTEYYGTLVPVLISTDGQSIVAEANTYPIDLQSGESQSQSYSGTFSASTAPDAGTYLLALMNTETGQAAGNALQVTLNAKPTSTSVAVNGFSADEETADGKVTFTMSVQCSEGYYGGSLTVAVFTLSGGSSVAQASSTAVHIAAGDTQQATATVDTSSLDPGTYMAAVYGGSQQLTNAVQFVVKAQTAINGAAAATAGKAYNLRGINVSPSQRGIVIKDGKKIFQ